MNVKIQHKYKIKNNKSAIIWRSKACWTKAAKTNCYHYEKNEKCQMKSQ